MYVLKYLMTKENHFVFLRYVNNTPFKSLTRISFIFDVTITLTSFKTLCIVIPSQKEANAIVGKIENFDDNFSPFGYSGDLSNDTNSQGFLVFKLHVTLKNLTKFASINEFKRGFRDELVKDMEALLEENVLGDTKIVTSDGAELFVHKAILAGS